MTSPPAPSGRVVLVTGVSAGIGRALVLEALRRGHRVSGCGRREERLDALRAEAGAAASRLHLAPADVTRPEETAAWIAGAVAAFGGVDAVIHNAGFGLAGPVELVTVEDYRHQFETNFFAVVRLTRELLPLLAGRPGGGDVILMSSILGRIGMPLSAPYCASKWALEGYAASIRTELRRRNVRVSVVEPGFTATDFPQAVVNRGPSRVRPTRFKMPAETVARATLDCLGRTRRHVPLTLLGRIGLLVSGLAPGLYERITRREIQREMVEESAPAAKG